MAENLKVNAKSKILTFKKKHNLLVDSVPQKNSDGDYQIFENIVDKDGHHRFIEGDIEILENNLPSGAEITYGKWSLSGTHLQVVLAGKLANGTIMKQYPTRYAYVNLPKWIMDKIFPSSNDWLDSKEVGYVPISSSGVASQKDRYSTYVSKPNNRLEIVADTPGANPITLQYASGFRFALDLLIDNEQL